MLALFLGLTGGIPNPQGAPPGSYLERALLAEEHAERGEWEEAALAMRRAIEVCVRAVSRTGMLSLPWLQTVRWR